MKTVKTATHVSFPDAVALGPPPKGNLAVPVFTHGTMEAELYSPRNKDPQSAHTRDEIYLVAKGESEFFNGESNVKVAEGSFIFVPAGTDHRFENISDDFSTWVFFYGPEGGEKGQ